MNRVNPVRQQIYKLIHETRYKEANAKYKAALATQSIAANDPVLLPLLRKYNLVDESGKVIESD